MKTVCFGPVKMLPAAGSKQMWAVDCGRRANKEVRYKYMRGHPDNDQLLTHEASN